MQRIQVMIRGGYSPNVVQVRQGMPVEIEFDRQESGDCSSRVVFPDLHLSAALPAHQRTTVRFTPQQAGSFGFACSMNMISGTLVVAPDGQAAGSAEPEQPNTCAGYAAADSVGEPTAAESEAAQAQERRAEIRDLSRRVIIGAVLSTPVLYAVMAQPLGAGWVPALLLNIGCSWH
ncbi:cupredoxin domain-containing protein [Mycobacterium marinum]|uniref:cupredoxin domain-containing protein n=1 Tax=Mycobacterium marinum TaxID=1781 RepID=UPI003BEEB585